MSINRVPIAFCFDDNLIMPAGICLTSLLENAKIDTFYDIFILHDKHATFQNSGYLERLAKKYTNFKITYKDVGDPFENAFEIRGITKAAYYRLLLPEVVLSYSRIMYFDVDIIFQNDLSDIYQNTTMNDFYVAGVSTPYSDIATYIEQVAQMKVNEYICSGTIIMNLELMRQRSVVEKFKSAAKKDWKYQDQDVLNLVCKGKIKILPPWFGIVGTLNDIFSDQNQSYYKKEEIEYALVNGTLHYNGGKPWNQFCYNFDIWWEYYRKSIYFDINYYHNFYRDRMSDLDALPLLKRTKLLLKYFVYGQKKN